MFLNLPLTRIFQFLKCVVVFLLFVLVVSLPFVGVFASQGQTAPNSNLSETVNNFLTMLGGGGIGVAGSNFIKGKQSPPDNSMPSFVPTDSPVSGFSPSSDVKELERRWLKDSQVIRSHQKKLSSKITSIEFFLGKKYEDFNRKDTMH